MQVHGLKNQYTVNPDNDGGTLSTVKAKAKFVLTPDESKDDKESIIIERDCYWDQSASELKIITKGQRMRDKMIAGLSTFGADYLTKCTLTSVDGTHTAYIPVVNQDLFYSILSTSFQVTDDQISEIKKVLSFNEGRLEGNLYSVSQQHFIFNKITANNKELPSEVLGMRVARW